MNDIEVIKNNLKMRNAVGIILIRNDGFVWTGKRRNGPGVRLGEKNLWQMPQGGIDEGENYFDAALRELKEETSIKSVELVKEISKYTTYDLPDRLLGIIWKGKYKGQKQKWFIVKFNGEENEININTCLLYTSDAADE